MTPDAAPTSLQRRRWLTTFGAAPLAAIAWPRLASAAACNDAAAWIPPDAFLADLPRLMQALRVPAIGMAVVERGEVVWSRNVGVTNAETRTPVADDTLFEDASLSKPVFAYLVLQLADQGVIDLDVPLVGYRRMDYLADHPWVDLVTARDVLRHSTGLPNWRKDPANEKLVPAVRPGTRIDYSGEAIFWLQLVVETLTGESLDQSMQRLLFGPAGMRDSSYTWSADLAARSVYGHRAVEDEETGMPPQMLRDTWNAAQVVADRWGKPLSAWHYEDAERALPDVQAIAPKGLVNWPGDILANAAASLRTTPADYARFMTLMVRTPREPWQITEATRREMLTKQIDVPGRWTDKGLGWNLEATPRGPVFYHSGSNGGIFKNFALGDAAGQRALVALTNGGSGNVLYRRVVRAATGHDLLAFDL
ncbi:CubicO group peptidase (beta-lactamase class C family) [Pseudoxanthomonas sp. 3HH-4]|uniref:serine hydrolase domain-containing protein n=1 Tax=Pseudoxanthomonas sp. 3HH-4 TaxID=1690214 RepID=UPI0011508959|nr:serine hydrolase domain-containing protein [Pseudoxanthomonas sp. 3HH-4]TQM16840.1 CubicO group peptidase (beta-lactamase class C family) [Pseudoxanthomonas sp. 3HH-4]